MLNTLLLFACGFELAVKKKIVFFFARLSVAFISFIVVSVLYGEKSENQLQVYTVAKLK